MIRFVLLTLFFIVLGAVVFTFVRNDSGFVHIGIGGYEIITSFWVATLGVLLAVFALWFLLSAVFALLTKTGSFWSVIGSRRHEKAEDLFSRGMLNYVEGNWQFAKEDLKKSAKHADNDHKIVATLAAVHCALEQKNHAEAHDLIVNARKVIGKESLALQLTEARLLDQTGDVHGAIEKLETILQQHEDNAVVLKQLAHEYEKYGNWGKLAELIPKLYRYDLLAPNELQLLKNKVFRKQLDERYNDASLTVEQKREQVEQLIKQADKATKKTSEVAQHIVAVLNELGETKQAEKLARQSLEDHWSEAMLETYAKIQTPDWHKQIDFLESERDTHPHSEALHLALARLTRKQSMKSKAEEYYQQAAGINQSQNIRFELAQFLVEQNRGKDALEALFELPGNESITAYLPSRLDYA